MWFHNPWERGGLRLSSPEAGPEIRTLVQVTLENVLLRTTSSKTGRKRPGAETKCKHQLRQRPGREIAA
jgi:hypothetical protein